MKINIPRKELVKALNIVRSAASSRGALPITANVLLKAAGKVLTLTCTDKDLYLRTEVDVTVTEPGKCTVRVDALTSLCRAFVGDTVALTALTNDLKVQCGDSSYKLGTLPTDEFPPFPALKEPVTFELPQGVVHQLLSDTRFCQGHDDQRPMLMGSFLQLNGKLCVAACDGKRVAEDSAEVDVKLPKTSCILPTKATRELLRLLEPNPGAAKPEAEPEGEPAGEDPKKKPTKAATPAAPISVAVTDQIAQFHLGHTVMVTRIIDGKFPDYTKIIPQTEDEGIQIGRADLLGILQRVGIIAEDCDIELAGQSLTVRGRGTKDLPGEAVETLLIPKVKKEVNLRFSVRFLSEALQAVGDDQVILHVIDSKSPAMFRVADRDWTCVMASITAPTKEKEKETDKKK